MRTPKQIRLETCYHEAGHAGAGYMLGWQIEKASVWSEEQLADDAAYAEADAIGQVRFAQRAIATNLEEAIDEIVSLYAGEAGSRIAYATRLVTDSDYGSRSVDETEIIHRALISPEDPVAAGVHFGFFQMPSGGDEAAAQEVAAKWTSSAAEKEQLLGFCRERTVSLASTELFGRGLVVIAAALEEHGEIDGELIHHLLGRAQVVSSTDERSPV